MRSKTSIMAPPTTSLTTRALSCILFLLAFSTQANALSVGKKAALGIGISFGGILIITAVCMLYLKFSRRGRMERQARRENPGLSHAEAIEMYARTQPKGFDIWNYDYKADKAKKKAAKLQQQHGVAEETGV